MNMNRVLKIFLLVISAGIIILQLGWVGQMSAGYVREKVWPNRSLDAISRSADVTYGSDFLAYMDFVRKETPPDAVVVDTRTFGVPQYDDNTFLQYFLLPRMVTDLSIGSCVGNSSMDDCLQTMVDTHVYFIYGQNFVISSSILNTFKVTPFNSSMGLLAPQR
jgi:hypothetical protein